MPLLRTCAPACLTGTALAIAVAACSPTSSRLVASDAAITRDSAVDGSARDASRPTADAGLHERDSGDVAPRDATTTLDALVDAAQPTEASTPSHLIAYGSGYGPDIFVSSVEPSTGALTVTQTLPAFGTSPSFLAVNPALTRLYAVDENTTGRVGAYSIAATTGALTFLNAVSSGGQGPPFVSVDATGTWVFVANYGDGSVSVLPVQADGSLGAATTTLSVGMNAHMIVADPSNRFVFVPCLGADYIAQFSFDSTTGALAPNATAPHVAAVTGAGPRHLAFHPNGRFAFVINETNSTLVTYSFDATLGTLAPVSTVSTLPPGDSGTNTAAEVHVHPSGKWLLASNRGANDLVVFAIDSTTGALSSPQFTSSGGMTPRDFSLAPGGQLVYAANETTGNVVPFTFNATSGALAATASPTPVPSASFVGVIALP